jgi:hypothetical protein
MKSFQNKERTAIWAWLLLTLVIVFAGMIRYGLVDVPLERDEGEYAYGAQLLLEGIPPYSQLYTMKLPGIFAAYAAIIGVLGQTPRAVHLGLLLVNSVSIFMVFLIGRKLKDELAGIVAAASFATLSLTPFVQGIFANAEHFVMLPALLGFFVLLLWQDRPRLRLAFSCGFLFGLSFIIKQHGMAFIALGFFSLAYSIFRQRKTIKEALIVLVIYLLGTLLPYLVTCLLLLSAGVFDSFWFWTVRYAKEYTSIIPLNAAWFDLKTKIVDLAKSAPLIWLLSILSLGLLSFIRTVRHKSFLALFLIFSSLAVCPGFFFRPHYFVFLLPAAAILAGISASFLFALVIQKPENYFTPTLFASVVILFVCGLTLAQHRQFLFESTAAEASQQIYWPNPFVESLELSKIIRERTTPQDTIAIIGSEPQILFYAGRKSATSYIYMYPLMEPHDFALQMQQEMIKQITRAKPKLLIYVRVHFSWLRMPESHLLIFDWFERYKTNYQRIGFIQIFDNVTLYNWAPPQSLRPSTPFYIEVYERKDSSKRQI